MTQDLQTTVSDRGKRLDKFLVEQGVSDTRGEIIRMIKSGAVEVNGKKSKPSHILQGQEYIFIGIYRDKSADVLPNRNISVDVVQGTDDFVIINKSRGMQVHPSHRERKNTLVNALLARFPEIVGVGEDVERPGIVHRLDKDTTGLMIVARNQVTFETLKALFGQKKIQKTYVALVFGTFEENVGTINAPIARATSYTKQKIAFGKYKGDARDAITDYEVLKTYHLTHDIDMTLVKVMPRTGRTHQIRVHMAHVGHPLVGDVRYYTKNEKKALITVPKVYDPHTFYLHAQELQFELNNEKFHFFVDLPERFQALVRYLDAHNIKNS